MGITYKLKKEVVGFVLDTKAENPCLSCRKIADLATQHFQRKISKSSVNSVLKNSSLSSPVGRRSTREKIPPVFRIPEERKAQLFQNVPEELIKTEALANFQPQTAPQPQESVGIYFLKAAEWEIAKEPFLSSILNKYTEHPLSREADILSDVLLYLPVFGICSVDQIIDLSLPTAFECLYGKDQKVDKEKIRNILFSIEAASKKEPDINLDFFQAFSRVSFFRFFMENGANFLIDSRISSVWTQNNVHSNIFIGLSRSLDFLSRFFISNNSPVLIQKVPQDNLAPCFCDMVYSFENILSHKIKRIEAVTPQGEVISSFSNILGRKRRFIAGLDTGNVEFKRFLDDNKESPKKVFCANIHKNFLLQEFAFPVPSPLGAHGEIVLRGAAFFEEQNPDKKKAIVSNMDQSQASLEELVCQYCDRWPGEETIFEKQETSCPGNFSFEGLKASIKDELGEGPLFGMPFAGKMMSQALLGLNEYVKQAFLLCTHQKESFLTLKQRFYSLSGQIAKSDSHLMIRLFLPLGYAYKDDLNYLINRINESAITTPSGAKLLFSISP